MSEWLNQSIEFEVAIAVGYLCTRLVTFSARPKFARDAAIQVFVWAVVVQLYITVAAHAIPSIPGGVDRAMSILIGSVLGLFTAVKWQTIGFSWAIGHLRRRGITYEDFRGGAWETICGRGAGITALVVHTLDDYVFESNIAQIPGNLIDGRVALAEDGIGMHITKMTRPGEDGEEVTFSDDGVIRDHNVEFTDFTYIPMSQIRRVSVMRARDGVDIV